MGPNWKELNDWKFIKVGPVLPKKAGEKQTEKLQEYEDECRTHHDHLLGDYDMRGLAEIEVGKTGAMEGTVNSECPDGYYLIRWTGTAFRLTEPWEVEGCAEPMPVGTWVCKGRYLTRVVGCPNWFYFHHNAPELLFRLQYVVVPDCTVQKYEKGRVEPNTWGNLRRDQRLCAKLNLFNVPDNMTSLIKQEVEYRNKLGYVEMEEAEEDAATGNTTQNGQGEDSGEEGNGEYSDSEDEE
jgi:hypothetical protein